MNDNELMNRRRFFKKTAREMLPMLGAFVAAPTVIMSTLTSCGCDDCEAACQDDCEGTCRYNCYDSCSSSSAGGGCSDCSSSCSGSSTSNTCSACANDCSTSCKDTCYSACSSSSENSNSGNSGISDATGKIGGYEYVDLGLSVKWARYNLGTSKPEGAGSYYWMAGGADVFDQLRNSGAKADFVISGTKFDNATSLWGSKWRTPTKAEVEELINGCTFEFTEFKATIGLKCISKVNGRSIFLPASDNRYNNYDGTFDKADLSLGYGEYIIGQIKDFTLKWSQCSIYTFGFFKSNKIGIDFEDMYRYKLTIRPVTTGSDSGGGCTGSGCSSNCANNSTGSSCTGCGSGCSNGCKDSCSGNCADSCRTGCGGSCNTSCGGSCTYLSRGSSCSGCATTCYNQCYTACTLACADNCQSSCVYGSK